MLLSGCGRHIVYAKVLKHYSSGLVVAATYRPQSADGMAIG